MAKKIEAINQDTIHRICSGQVVLNLAIAVKELVENSLDAKATAIEVRLKEYGSESIEVSDNGNGIHPEDFESLALKHHTSKIKDFGDLVDVETFGFRGEALSSLCAVSGMIVTTRYVDETCGSKLKFDHRGFLQEQESFPRQVGTTITLTNLFASLPVRQKEFHRNLKKEFIKAVQLLSAYCLISSNVKITCVNVTKKCRKITFLSTQENKTIRENISCVFGPKQLTNLLQINDTVVNEEILEEYGIEEVHVGTFKLNGFISSCEHGSGRSTTDRQFYYINSRPCEPIKVIKLTNDVYHRYNPHQYPFVLMNINVGRQAVDVNVTPDKRVIFLENEKLLLATVKSTMMKIFENISSIYRINTSLPLISSETIQRRKDVSCNLLLDLNKWRHSTDTSTREQATIRTQKRRSPPKLPQISYSKQMKLDQVFKRANIVKNSKQVREASEEDKNSARITAACTKEEIYFGNMAVFEENCIKEKNDAEIETNCVQIFPNSVDREKVLADQELSISSEVEFEENHSQTFPDLMEMSVNDETEIIISPKKMQLVDDISPLGAEMKNQQAEIDTDIKRIYKFHRENRQLKKDSACINKFHVEIDPNKNDSAEEELKKEISKSMFCKMKIIGQFNLGFIITKLENDLFIIDQHATDEKYNFETLQRTTTLKSQKLIIPQDLNLTVTNECILMDNIGILEKNGFRFEIDSAADTTIKVKLISIPVSRNWQFGKEDIDEMLFMLQDAPNTLCRPSRIRAMFASRACRKSIMIGTPLAVKDMRRIINNMGAIDQPWNCPHGRPTMRHLVNLSLLT